MKTSILFVRDQKELNSELEDLKQKRCPRCGRTGTLNRHDTLDGNDPGSVNKKIKRGRRAWCSNRGRRRGCGRTVAIFLAWVLPRHSVTAPLLDKVLDGLCGGLSIHRAWEEAGMPGPVETTCHLLRRLRERLDQVRTTLCGERDPPDSEQDDSLRQTAEHLRCAFPLPACAVEAYQVRFQAPIMG